MSKYLITTDGGLGNEIISYALWLHLREKGKRPLLFLRRNLLGQVFPKTYTTARWPFLFYNYIKFHKKYRSLQRFILRLCKLNFSISSLLPYEVVDFPEWGTYQFLWSEAKILRQHLVFPTETDKRNTTLIQQMQRTQSVSIHIRRGDYQNSPYWRVILGDICEADYYKQAIEKIETIFDSPTYFVFSDDIEWVKQSLSLPDATFIDWNIGRSYFRDLQLMSYCKANILANSTFSLCGTFFSHYPNPIRIAPSKWLNMKEDNLREKYLPQDCIVINNDRPTISIILECPNSETIHSNLQKQSFDDFEIVTDSAHAKGQIRLTLTKATAQHLKNRNFLKSFLLKTYTNEQRK